MTGILLLACGHDNYFRMALNCAVSIKANYELKVALAYRGSLTSFTEEELRYFDYLVPVQNNHILYKGEENLSLLKLNMYDLSPFTETIYLDVDSLCLYSLNINQLLNEARRFSVQFDIQDDTSVYSGEGEWNYFLYPPERGGLTKIREVYHVDSEVPVYKMQSSFLYFRKDPVARQFFDLAITSFCEDKLQLLDNWNGWLLDELNFMIAQAKLQLRMTSPFRKVYYSNYEGYIGTEVQLNEILKNYYFYSIPGIYSHDVFARLYNELCYEYYRHEKLNTSRMFHYQNKHQYMPERISL